MQDRRLTGRILLVTLRPPSVLILVTFESSVRQLQSVIDILKHIANCMYRLALTFRYAALKRRVLAHGDYTSISNSRTKIMAIFLDVFVICLRCFKLVTYLFHSFSGNPKRFSVEPSLRITALHSTLNLDRCLTEISHFSKILTR